MAFTFASFKPTFHMFLNRGKQQVTPKSQSIISQKIDSSGEKKRYLHAQIYTHIPLFKYNINHSFFIL